MNTPTSTSAAIIPPAAGHDLKNQETETAVFCLEVESMSSYLIVYFVWVFTCLSLCFLVFFLVCLLNSFIDTVLGNHE